MRSNIQKVMDRGEKLDDIDAKAGLCLKSMGS